MRRFARALLYGGIVCSVLGLSKIHAAYVADPAYDYTGSSRFAWSIAYMALLAIAAYGVGLPDEPRSPRAAVGSSLGAATGAAVGISLIQLIVGDALLPRFVVFGAALLLVPWYMLCCALFSGGRARAAVNQQVAVIAGPDAVEALRADLATSALRPASVVAALSVDVARAHDHRLPVREAVEANGATVLVLDRDAQDDSSVVAQAALLHEQGCRVRTYSLFYEQWLGKLPLSELERVSLLFDIGELHQPTYGRTKRILDLVFVVAGFVALAVALPFVIIGDLLANRGSLFYRQSRVGKGGSTFVN
jgi:hypothetical protein